jgi:hypothetical protein
MRKYFLSLPVFLSFVFCVAQNKSDTCLDCYKNPLKLGLTKKCLPAESQHLDPAVHATIRKRQENYLFHRTMRMLQEPSTVTSFTTWTINNLGYDKKNFVLDADLQIPISFGGKRFGLNEVEVIPRFQVRIFHNDPNVPYGPNGDVSLPVRTPSAMPGAAYYHSFRSWWEKEKFPFRFIGLYAYHHSNGQDGYELDTTNNQKRVNVYNGNFSEDLVFEFMIGGRIKSIANDKPLLSESNKNKVHDNKPGKQIFIKRANEQEFYWKLSYEWHPQALSNTVFDSLHMMGRHRINIRSALIFLPTFSEYIGDGTQWCNIVPEKRYERWRITGNLSYILDGDYYRGDVANLEKINFFNLNRRLNFWVTGYRVIGHSGNAAVFAQAGYWGSDNYNIYFNESLWQFKFGLAFAFFDQPDEEDHLK